MSIFIEVIESCSEGIKSFPIFSKSNKFFSLHKCNIHTKQVGVEIEYNSSSVISLLIFDTMFLKSMLSFGY